MLNDLRFINLIRYAMMNTIIPSSDNSPLSLPTISSKLGGVEGWKGRTCRLSLAVAPVIRPGYPTSDLKGRGGRASMLGIDPGTLGLIGNEWRSFPIQSRKTPNLSPLLSHAATTRTFPLLRYVQKQGPPLLLSHAATARTFPLLRPAWKRGPPLPRQLSHA